MLYNTSRRTRKYLVIDYQKVLISLNDYLNAVLAFFTENQISLIMKQILLGQLFYTNFGGSGFQFVRSPSVSENVERIFRDQIIVKHWVDIAPPPKDWRAAYILQFEQSQTIFGWAYNDGRDDTGRDDVPYFLAYQLNLPLNRRLVDLILSFLGQGPETAPSRLRHPLTLQDIMAPDLWIYSPERPGVVIDTLTSESVYSNLWARKDIELFVVAPPDTLEFKFNEQVCERLALILAQYINSAPKKIIDKLPPQIRFWYLSRNIAPYKIIVRQAIEEETDSMFDPEKRVLQVINRLAAEINNDLDRAEFTQRIKALLGVLDTK